MNNKVKIIKSEKLWIEGKAIDQLIKFAELKGILKAIGLPDLHPGKTPIGAAYLTKDIIYPHIIGNDIGCGLSLFSTGVNENNFKADKVIKKLNKLKILEEDKSPSCTQKLGTIGSGNHFAEFQKINVIFDTESFLKLGLDCKEILLLVHSGSRAYGENILNKYINEYACLDGLPINTVGFNNYFTEYQKALDFAKVNRELIAEKITSYLSFSIKNLISDSIHNGIFEKKIKGCKYFIHRKGAAPSDNGIVVIAGSRGTNSYIVEPKADLEECIFSISHGAGRKWSRSSCKERLEKKYSKGSIGKDCISGANIIYRDKSLIYEEAPEAYKNIERVIGDMLDQGMIKLIASLSPLITYKV